jgi:hypothetical protein
MPAIGDGARAQGGSMSARGGIYRGPGGEQLYGDGRQVESARPPEHQTQPYKVRASCGHIVIRRMRPGFPTYFTRSPHYILITKEVKP